MPVGPSLPIVSVLSQTTVANTSTVTLTITGSGFYAGGASPNVLYMILSETTNFNTFGIPSFSVQSDSQMTCVIPAHTIGNGNYYVLVTTPNGTNSTSPILTYTAPAAIVVSLNPNSCIVGNTTTVTINGSGFWGGMLGGDVIDIFLINGTITTTVTYNPQSVILSDTNIREVFASNLPVGSYNVVVQTSVNYSNGVPFIVNSTPVVLIAPTELQGTAGKDNIHLFWNPVNGATGYKVRIGTSTNSWTGTVVDVGNNINFTLTPANGIITNTAYYIVVSAYNILGDGPNSFEIKRTTFSKYTTQDDVPTSLLGYLPSDLIIGSMPFKVAPIAVGSDDLLDQDYEIAICENSSVITNTIVKSGSEYENLNVTPGYQLISIDDVRSINGYKYYLNQDYYLLNNNIYWTSTSTPTIGVAYNIIYKVAQIVDIIDSNKLTGISGSADPKIRELTFIPQEDATRYVVLYDDPTKIKPRLDIYTSLADLTASINLYAYADIPDYTGYYSYTVTNLISNPSFENTLLGTWSSTVTSSTTLVSGIITQSSNFKQSGLYSALFSATFTTMSNITAGFITANNITNINSSDIYTLSFYYKSISLIFPKAIIREYDQTGAFIAETSLSLTGTNTGIFDRYYSTFTTQSNTDQVQIILGFHSTPLGFPINQQVYFDCIQLENNNKVSLYADSVLDNATINANIIKVLDSSIIGNTSIKFISGYLTTDYEYTPYDQQLVEYQNGNAVKAFGYNFLTRTEEIDRTIYHMVRVVGNKSESLYSNYNILTIPQGYQQAATERMFGGLPDNNIYYLDLLKLAPEDRINYNIYYVEQMYGYEMDNSYFETKQTRWDTILDLCRDTNFETNFSLIYNLEKPMDLKYAEFRNFIKNFNIATTLGSTEAAINTVVNSLTAVNPDILLIRDYDWWLLNGNKILNSNFEDLVNPLHDWLFLNSVTNNSVSSSYSRFGNYSLQQGSLIAGTQKSTTNTFPVEQNKNYSLEFSYYNFTGATITATTTHPLSWNINFYGTTVSLSMSGTYTVTTVNNNVLLNSYYNYTEPIKVGQWVDIIDPTILAPVNASYANLQLNTSFSTSNQFIYFDGFQLESSPTTPFEEFEYYLDDPNYPDIVPPTLFDKNEYAFAVIISIKNPYGFALDKSLIQEAIYKVVPAHIKVYLVWETTAQSIGNFVWDVSNWDEANWQ